MEETKNSWCLIPPMIWEDENLNLTEKCLLGRINALQEKTGACFASNEYLGRQLGKHQNHISRLLTKLKRKGYIEVVIERNERREITHRSLYLLTPMLIPINTNVNTPINTNVKDRIDILDKNIDNNNGSSEELPPTSKNSNYKTEYGQKYIDAFNRFFNSNYRLTPKRITKLKARFKTYTADEIAQALINLSESKFHQGDNDRGWKADPDFLIENDERIDIWLNKGVKLNA